MTRGPQDVDVLIVGSGPVGSAAARVIKERAPDVAVLLIDAGPQLTTVPGVHVKNIADPQERARAQERSQGPTPQPYAPVPLGARAHAGAEERPALLARPGTFLLRDDGGDSADMPAAALSTNVGGMGAHWTCACPAPAAAERVSFIPEGEWDAALAEAESLLGVTRAAYPETDSARAIRGALQRVFADVLERPVQPMPLAARVEDGVRHWSGTDVVLGPLAHGGLPSFELRPETLCTALHVEQGRVTGATLRPVSGGEPYPVQARTVFVAADALRTPQLLWASGIRPRALGHYLNDQPQVLGAAQLDPALLPAQPDAAVGGVSWVPYAPGHPFHGQVMELDASPVPIPEAQDSGTPVVGLGWFCAKTPRFEDYLEFSGREVDASGLPKITVHHALTPEDEAAVAAAKVEVARAAAALGRPLTADPPFLLPAGSSLHYQGTVRMGNVDDGESVCDPASRVWGVGNLYVGGNGVIPTATACNPTLTAVALAVLACGQIVQRLALGRDVSAVV